MYVTEEKKSLLLVLFKKICVQARNRPETIWQTYAQLE